MKPAKDQAAIDLGLAVEVDAADLEAAVGEGAVEEDSGVEEDEAAIMAAAVAEIGNGSTVFLVLMPPKKCEEKFDHDQNDDQGF